MYDSKYIGYIIIVVANVKKSKLQREQVKQKEILSLER